MSVNYTPDQVNMMKAEYTSNPSRETVEKLAETLDKSIKSIIGKLSREGVYKKTVYKTKTGEDPETKKEIVQDIAEMLYIDYGLVAGLEKSPKASLKELRTGIENECLDK
jgi:Zn-dependent M32 family carboxypeptidase|tara:strand:+ start:1400 stop:1729 length:330 start_codon:yes stop_codon:yes gene_type:complete